MGICLKLFKTPYWLSASGFYVTCLRHLIKKSSAALHWSSLRQSEEIECCSLLQLCFQWLSIGDGKSAMVEIYTSEIIEIHKSEAPCSPRAQSINMYQCTTVKWIRRQWNQWKKVPHKEYVFSSTLYSPCSLQCVGHGHWNSIREI